VPWNNVPNLYRYRKKAWRRNVSGLFLRWSPAGLKNGEQYGQRRIGGFARKSVEIRAFCSRTAGHPECRIELVLAGMASAQMKLMDL
jgi:hypothetical protein